jgi:hypothetical protein
LIELKSMAVYRVSAMKRPDFIALSWNMEYGLTIGICDSQSLI